MGEPDNISEKEQAYWEGRAEAQAEIDRLNEALTRKIAMNEIHEGAYAVAQEKIDELKAHIRLGLEEAHTDEEVLDWNAKAIELLQE